MRFEIDLIPHNKLDNNNLGKIVSLKMQHWDYKKEDQIKWINENLEDGDYHLLLKNEKDVLMAYLNIVPVRVSMCGSVALFSGIGNVCVNSKHGGKGYGLLIMNIAGFFIKEFKRPGILMCKEQLISFYKKAGWHKYNGKAVLNKQLFSGKIFFSEKVLSSVIEVEKNF